MSRRKTTPEGPAEETSFEDALIGLDSIVEAMEREQLPLEDLVTYYEKGSVLLDRCEKILHSAKERIELITLRSQNGLGSSATANDGDSTPPSGSPDDSDDDDIRLF
jgi:exodeoxyribonuclease VII small subunit